ncbi:response regulator transcription factor [Plesiomonas sp.]|uniref:response regulator transcription factor n=1 Tax=Plesiomonas sp. TaxID=2486279 RepID=UPI003F39194D
MANIVLLEDEQDLRDEMLIFLRACGHTVTAVANCADFTPLIPQIGIAIIDINLPDGSGFDMAAHLRQRKATAGIIILTARLSTEDKLHGLYGGADHYLTKPIKLLELTAIIDSLSRRMGGNTEWCINTQQQSLRTPSGEQAEISASEMTLLLLLAANPHKIVSRKQIVEAFGYTWLDYDLRRLDTLVSRFRRRWRDRYAIELPLKTAHRDGYRFCAPLKTDE